LLELTVSAHLEKSFCSLMRGQSKHAISGKNNYAFCFFNFNGLNVGSPYMFLPFMLPSAFGF